MEITITTQVESNWREVQRGFTAELFLRLNPPFPPVKLERFDGCLKGNRVELVLQFFLFTQRWVSVITEDGQDNEGFYFIDEGEKLPFFLKRWKHRHIIKSSKTGSQITDRIEYSSGFWLTDLLLYPVLYGQFLYRKPIYKKLFKGRK